MLSTSAFKIDLCLVIESCARDIRVFISIRPLLDHLETSVSSFMYSGSTSLSVVGIKTLPRTNIKSISISRGFYHRLMVYFPISYGMDLSAVQRLFDQARVGAVKSLVGCPARVCTAKSYEAAL